MMKQKNTKSEEDVSLFPIRTVSRLTGVNAITLRAWERRYGLITPVRTSKGHRLYSQEDIDLIQQVTQLLEKGISIGQVKNYLQAGRHDTEFIKTTDQWLNYRRRMLNAVLRFDTKALDGVYNEAMAVYPEQLVTKKILLPLLETLGTRWAEEEGSIAEEHFFGTFMRNKVGAQFHHQSMRGEGPILVAACLPDERHEIGLMLFCLAAIRDGFQIILLGCDIPIEELLEPARRSRCAALLLSGSVEPGDNVLNKALPALVEGVDAPVFIGGKVSILAHDAIVKAGAVSLGVEFQPALERIHQQLS